MRANLGSGLRARTAQEAASQRAADRRPSLHIPTPASMPLRQCVADRANADCAHNANASYHGGAIAGGWADGHAGIADTAAIGVIGCNKSKPE